MTNSGTQLGPNPKAQPGPNYLPPRFRNLLLQMTAILVLVFVFRRGGHETSMGDSWVLVGSYLGPSLALAPPAKPYSRHPPSRKPPSKNSPLWGDPTNMNSGYAICSRRAGQGAHWINHRSNKSSNTKTSRRGLGQHLGFERGCGFVNQVCCDFGVCEINAHPPNRRHGGKDPPHPRVSRFGSLFESSLACNVGVHLPMPYSTQKPVNFEMRGCCGILLT